MEEWALQVAGSTRYYVAMSPMLEIQLGNRVEALKGEYCEMGRLKGKLETVMKGIEEPLRFDRVHIPDTDNSKGST